jgi:hypothetical protein
MAQGIVARDEGERLLKEEPDAVVAALNAEKSLLKVAKQLGVVTDGDPVAKILEDMSEQDQAKVRSTVLAALNAKRTPKYDCKIADPADHVAKGKGLNVQPSGDTIKFSAT